MPRSSLAIPLSLALAALIAACNPTAADPTADPTTAPTESAPEISELAGTSWVLAQIMWAPPLTRITLDFTETQISGTACASYGGGYTTIALWPEQDFPEGQISIPVIENEDAGCAESEAATEQVSHYLDILQQVSRYQISPDGLLNLEMPASDPCCLIFRPAEGAPEVVNLVSGTSWIVTHINDQPVLPDAPITASFDAAQINGSAGCNQYSAAYTLGDIMRLPDHVGAVTTTKKLCDNAQGVMDQEALFVDVLGSITRISRNGQGQLRMLNDDNTSSLILTLEGYEPTVNSLIGTEWTLTTMNGSTPIDGTAPTVAFTDGSALVFAGCNTAGGNYDIAQGGRVHIYWLGGPHEVCETPAGIMEQETAYIELVQRMTRYEITDDTLSLHNDAGETLVFRLSGN